ncbi:MAG: hypothetical protein DHS20C11_34890 [Lysobacteraceae bacterium]|nr:MAG: hypothetical protein DHS20C11_34890 [Xanthomonadaceae bacterium]
MNILYPAFAMFALTIFILLRMGYHRVSAIKGKKMSIKFFRDYSGEQPEYLRVMERHFANLCETPMLFYVGVILAVVTNSASSFVIIVAWVYFALRCVHSLIHLTTNNVNQRFFAFILSVTALVVMWGMIAVSVISRTS